MFYYTHYGGMEAPHHVHIDVPSDYVLLNVLLSTPQRYAHSTMLKRKKGLILLF